MSSTSQDQNQELQTKVMQIRYLESYLQDLSTRESMAMSALREIENAEVTVGELSKGEGYDTLIHIGGGMYVSGNINSMKKVLAILGADVAVEKSVQDTLGFIQERKQGIRNAINEIMQQKQQASNTMQALRQDVENTLGRK